MELTFYAVIFLATYSGCCLLLCLRSSHQNKSAINYFIGARSISMTPAALLITIASVGSIGFLDHLALIKRDGFPYATVSLFVIVVPLTGVFFLTRQWIVARRFGYVTPGEMLAGYYLSPTIRFIAVFVAVFFALPFVASQIFLAGKIVEICTGGYISTGVGSALFAIVLVIYVVIGGCRAITLVGSLQFVLFVVGAVIVSWAVIDNLGGYEQILNKLAQTGSRPDQSVWGRTASGHNSYLSIPAIFQLSNVASGELPVGGPWTTTMIFTYLISFLGIQTSPAMSMCAFSNQSPRGIALQSMWVLPILVGVLSLVLLMAAAPGSSFLQNGALVSTPDSSLFASFPVFLTVDWDAFSLSMRQPLPLWIVALLATSAISLLHATCAIFLFSASAMLTRDVIKAEFVADMSHQAQIKTSRLITILLLVMAFMFATLTPHAISVIGKLSAGLSLQLLPALVGVCWLPSISRRGVLLGLVAGLLVVFATDQTGIFLLEKIEKISTKWSPWPLNVHAAVWGLVVNAIIVLLVTAFNREAANSRHRERVHRYLNDHVRKVPRRSRRAPNAWIMMIVWFLFAIGPGAILGNRVFGDPAAGPDGWRLILPSLWAWQVVWWVSGALMLWYLGYRMNLTSDPIRHIDPLVSDAADAQSRS